MTVFVRKLIII